MRMWTLLVFYALLIAAPSYAAVSAGCAQFGFGTTYTTLQNWPYDAVRLRVPWWPACFNFTCVAPPALVGATVHQTGNIVTIDMFGSDDGLPPSVLVTAPTANPEGPVVVDVGPLAPGTYKVQGSVYGVTSGVVTELCNGPRTFATLTIEQAVGSVARQTAVEFYSQSRGHYFISSDPSEIAALDIGSTPGWARTGRSFAVFAAGKSGGVGAPVCRFYGSPDAGLDSHFYTANATECATLPGLFGGAWKLETPNAFEVRLADAQGGCPAGFIPIYRFWNRRIDSNHRFTTDPAIAAEMRNKGWAEELSSMCSPP